MTVFIDAEKAFDRMHHPFRTKNSTNWELRDLLRLIFFKNYGYCHISS
jgi:hypothetical protein